MWPSFLGVRSVSQPIAIGWTAVGQQAVQCSLSQTLALILFGPASVLSAFIEVLFC